MGEASVENTVSISSKDTTVQLHLDLNGEERVFEADPRTTVLDALREYLGLTGSKKGCDHGQCGACTVHINGRRTLSCLAFAIAHQCDKITTIEGLAINGDLHPMQSAFIDCDAFQCGYCTPGQIMSAVGMLEEAAQQIPSHVTPDVLAAPGAADLSDEEIRERMSGNLCRCGAYPNIVDAIREVQTSVVEGL
jgi:xanthine dehydrogenase YagT iron-sulfur-binding subunit